MKEDCKGRDRHRPYRTIPISVQMMGCVLMASCTMKCPTHRTAHSSGLQGVFHSLSDLLIITPTRTYQSKSCTRKLQKQAAYTWNKMCFSKRLQKDKIQLVSSEMELEVGEGLTGEEVVVEAAHRRRHHRHPLEETLSLH